MNRTALKFFIAAIAGMVVLVIWGMIFWAFLAPPLGVFHALPNAPEVTKVLVDGGVRTGTYFMPWPRSTPREFEQFVAQHKSGPFYRLSFVREGVDPESPGKLIVGCLHYLLVASIGVTILLLAGRKTFFRKAAIIFLGGLLGTVFTTLGDVVWFHMPWDYTTGVLLYEISTWLLLAVTIAWLSPVTGD